MKAEVKNKQSSYSGRYKNDFDKEVEDALRDLIRLIKGDNWDMEVDYEKEVIYVIAPNGSRYTINVFACSASACIESVWNKIVCK